jgi:hypothetical protein
MNGDESEEQEIKRTAEFQKPKLCATCWWPKRADGVERRGRELVMTGQIEHHARSTPKFEPVSRGRQAVRGAGGRCTVTAVTCLATFVACLLEAGCGARTIWKAEIRSPDGHYVAMARTIQNGGFGNSWIIATVSLQQASIPETRMTVLSFSCNGPVPHPYTLDNKANVGGTINLSMKWLTPTHLEVTYNGHDGTLNFQAVKYQGIHISVRELGSG